MSLMDQLITSKQPSPPKVILYGVAGVGKTTFASSAEAILVDCENGAGNVPGVIRTPYLETWARIREWLVELASNDLPEGAHAVAIDTIDWMVRRIIEHVILDLDPKAQGNITNTLGTAHGGYFKARDIVANIIYRDVLPMLNAVADRGAPVILLAHACNTKITTPEGYDQRLAAPDLEQWIAPPFIEWADAVLYAGFEDGERTMRAVGNNVVLAKNRFDLPETLPLSWSAFVDGMRQTTGTPKDSTKPANEPSQAS